MQSMSKNQRAVTRNRKIGFVFQNYNLLPKTTAVENVELPLLYNSSVGARERREKAIAALKAVGLGERLNHKSNQMSGGQQQRVAIARALIAKPDIIFADEPTGNLDSKSGSEVMKMLCGIREKMNKTLVVITHDPQIAKMAARRFTIVDGVLLEAAAPSEGYGKVW